MKKIIIACVVLTLTACSTVKPTRYDIIDNNHDVEKSEPIVKKGLKYDIVRSAVQALQERFEGKVVNRDTHITVTTHSYVSGISCNSLKIVDNKDTYIVTPPDDATVTRVLGKKRQTVDLNYRLYTVAKVYFNPIGKDETEIKVKVNQKINQITKVYSDRRKRRIIDASRDTYTVHSDDGTFLKILGNRVACYSTHLMEETIYGVISGMKVYSYAKAREAAAPKTIAVPNIVINNNNGDNSGNSTTTTTTTSTLPGAGISNNITVH